MSRPPPPTGVLLEGLTAPRAPRRDSLRSSRARFARGKDASERAAGRDASERGECGRWRAGRKLVEGWRGGGLLFSASGKLGGRSGVSARLLRTFDVGGGRARRQRLGLRRARGSGLERRRWNRKHRLRRLLRDRPE